MVSVIYDTDWHWTDPNYPNSSHNSHNWPIKLILTHKRAKRVSRVSLKHAKNKHRHKKHAQYIRYINQSDTNTAMRAARWWVRSKWELQWCSQVHCSSVLRCFEGYLTLHSLICVMCQHYRCWNIFITGTLHLTGSLTLVMRCLSEAFLLPSFRIGSDPPSDSVL